MKRRGVGLTKGGTEASWNEMQVCLETNQFMSLHVWRQGRPRPFLQAVWVLSSLVLQTGYMTNEHVIL